MGGGRDSVAAVDQIALHPVGGRHLLGHGQHDGLQLGPVQSAALAFAFDSLLHVGHVRFVQLIAQGRDGLGQRFPSGHIAVLGRFRRGQHLARRGSEQPVQLPGGAVHPGHVQGAFQLQVRPPGTQQFRHGGGAQAGFIVIGGFDFVGPGLQSGHSAGNGQAQVVAAAHGQGNIPGGCLRFLYQRGDFFGQAEPGSILQGHAGRPGVHSGLNRFLHIRELCAGGVAADKFHVGAQGLRGLYQFGDPFNGLGRFQMGDVFQLRAGQRHGNDQPGLLRALDRFPGKLHFVHRNAGVKGQYAALDRGA